MEKLPPKFKAKWLRALRSGKYKQGQYQLKKDGHYCCLGVACEIQGIKKLGNYQWIEDVDENGVVPEVLHPSRTESRITSKLSEMNDSGVSFEGIANWIEKNL